jgi:hypothetical protein
MIADPSNANIYLRSKSFEADCQMEDPWFHTKFTKQPFSEELVNLMLNPKAS